MFDGFYQRSTGEARVTLNRSGIGAIRQGGSVRVMVPRVGGAAPELVILNTAGGLASGDRCEIALTLAPGAAGCATTQTAERAYRAEGGPPAVVRLDFALGAGASLDWLPQETILFQDAAVDRVTRVRMAADARYLGIETLVLGRAAMGETVTRLALRDRREIWRGGRPALCEALAIDGDALARPGPALLGGARALASVMLLAPSAEDALPAMRAALAQEGVEAAASARSGQVVVRLRAGDGWPMRRQIARLIAVLRRDGLPRVWQDMEITQ